MRRGSLRAAAFLGSMVAVPALAQAGAAVPSDDTIAAESADAESDDDDREILVVAQKRFENLQDVPISIAAFDEVKLANANVVTVTDLGRIATNFSATKNTQVSNLRLTIRGIGAPGNTATEPSVAAFVDGVYIPRPGAIIGSFLDIENVEVLRGPQGTLFGRNASVGALQLRSAMPQYDFSASLTGEYGTSNRYKVSGHVNVPVSDNVAIRVAGLGQWFDGFWRNRLDGRHFGGLDDVAARASLRAEFGPVEWIVRADYARTEGNGFPNTSFDANSVSAAQLAAFQARLGGQLPDTVRGDRFANQFITADVNDRQWGVSSDLSVDADGFTIRLINSFRDWKNDQLDGDVIFTPVPLASRIEGRRSDSHNHELQVISPQNDLLDGRLDFVAGLYYFEEDYSINERLQLNSQFCNALVPAASRPTCNGLLAAGRGVDATNQDFSQSVKGFAAYGQATFAVTDTIDLTLGTRWSQDKKRGTYVQLLNNPFAAGLRAPENVGLRVDDDEFSWRASINWKPNEDLLFFANYSTGYKSGGFNSGGGATALDLGRIFGSETTKNYELGAKTEWLSGALRANLTLYRMDIAGFQDRAFDGVSFVVRNAGNLRHQGIELDAVISPSRRFSLTSSLAYLDSKFTSYANAPGLPGLGGIQDLRGARNTYAPEFTANLGAEWKGDLGRSGMKWSINGNLALISDSNIGAVTDNNPQTVEDGYALLGFRLSLLGPRIAGTYRCSAAMSPDKTTASRDSTRFLIAPSGYATASSRGAPPCAAKRAIPAHWVSPAQSDSRQKPEKQARWRSS